MVKDWRCECGLSICSVPTGCYPRCPTGKPLFDEDNMRCVTEEECGCYVDDTHYPPETSIPSDDICQSWYMNPGA